MGPGLSVFAFASHWPEASAGKIYDLGGGNPLQMTAPPSLLSAANTVRSGEMCPEGRCSRAQVTHHIVQHEVRDKDEGGPLGVF